MSNCRMPRSAADGKSPAAGSMMRKSAAALVVLTIVYATALLLLDQGKVESSVFWTISRSLPLAALFTFLGFVLRYLRWCWLLRARRYVVPLGTGFLAYLAGFALTASPGKVGELIRIRYFSAMGVPAEQVIACFIAERLLDLFALLLLSTLLAGSAPGLGLGMAFVFIVATSVYVLAQPGVRYWPLVYMRRRGWRRPARAVSALGRGLALSLAFTHWRVFIPAYALGVAAWSLQAYGLVVILGDLGLSLPPVDALAIQPAGMLIGAASLLPGGIGTTEVAIILMLESFEVPRATAAMAAIATRVSTLWLAIVLGLLAISILETCYRRDNARCHKPPPDAE
jgi:uncharacterized membrane protein YbhN (UPF0104 family)